MSRFGKSDVLAAGLALSALLLMERSANALPVACSTLSNPLVIESGDTQEPMLKTLGKKLRDSLTPMTVIYRTTGTCALIGDIYHSPLPNKIPTAAVMLYTPSSVEDPTWNPSKPAASCTIDDATGLNIDIAIAATFVSSCTTAAPPAGYGLISGPIQGYTFIVPKASTQTAIIAEEGYFAFGFGSAGMVQPWTDTNYFFTRTPSKSTALTLAAAIGLPVGKLLGVAFDKSTEVLNAVATSPSPEKTIGLMGSEIYDNNRGKVTVLPFQAFKQRHAYFPDSSATVFDKRNLRDGHYVPWAPTVYLTAVDGTNTPTLPNAKQFIELVLGKTALPDVDGLAAIISRGLIPDCAMKVTRAFDGGDLSLYAPATPCGCYYESKVPGGATSCTACTDDTPCGGGKCRYSFCEAK
jgi:hypothetical protein